MSNQSQPETVYVRAQWAMRRYSLSRTTLWRQVKAGAFPPPCRLPGGQRRWLLAELLKWEDEHLKPAKVAP